ncbi:MerR family transcriptional regulator, partial [Actinomadura sp. NPDC048032]|uniref:MerR family transcriptional regulator n=1 Tax=Actinomadura sp. NPDC048032 TaxID=3155747 RepID=UPI0034107A89
MDDDTWTIAELADHAAAALAAGASAQVSGRVRDLPNERLIRWYTTIGLIDPPLGRRGRTALYGPRHLLQLVAVKRRQASGRSIAEIQIELAAATDAELAKIAAVPPPPADLPAPPTPSSGRASAPLGSNAPAIRDADQAPHRDSPARPEGQGMPPPARLSAARP